MYSSYFLLKIADLKKHVLFLSRDLLTLDEQLSIQMIAHFVAEKTSFRKRYVSSLCNKNCRRGRRLSEVKI